MATLQERYDIALSTLRIIAQRSDEADTVELAQSVADALVEDAKKEPDSQK